MIITIERFILLRNKKFNLEKKIRQFEKKMYIIIKIICVQLNIFKDVYKK